jgi:hypothetical protein
MSARPFPQPAQNVAPAVLLVPHSGHTNASPAIPGCSGGDMFSSSGLSSSTVHPAAAQAGSSSF